jgi:hypothetical protein
MSVFFIAFWLNPPFNIILRRQAFLTIGGVGGEGGGGRHWQQNWREQTKARGFALFLHIFRRRSTSYSDIPSMTFKFKLM